MPSQLQPDETQAVRERYARRAAHDARYSLLNPSALLPWHERQRAMLRLLARMGFAPEHLSGIELLPERHAFARGR